jgi:hypothetical protein
MLQDKVITQGRQTPHRWRSHDPSFAEGEGEGSMVSRAQQAYGQVVLNAMYRQLLWRDSHCPDKDACSTKRVDYRRLSFIVTRALFCGGARGCSLACALALPGGLSFDCCAVCCCLRHPQQTGPPRIHIKSHSTCNPLLSTQRLPYNFPQSSSSAPSAHAHAQLTPHHPDIFTDLTHHG